jgi:hypothetical protein
MDQPVFGLWKKLAIPAALPLLVILKPQPCRQLEIGPHP